MYKDIRDEYVWTKERKILTEKETGIVGLESFGYNHQVIAKRPQDIHFHKDSIEITYVINGEYYLNVNGTDYVATGGDIVITQPNELHSTGMAPRAVNEIFWMHIRMNTPENFMGLSAPWNEILFHALLSAKDYIFHVGLSHAETLEDAMNCFFTRDLQSIAVGRNFIIGFLNTFLRKEKIKQKSVSLSIHKTLAYIHNHIYESISLEQLAEISNLSLSRFKAKFKEEVGITPNIYINQQKIHMAQNMLLDGMSITETAYALDFSSSNYFSSVFKKITSMQPRDFVKANRKG